MSKEPVVGYLAGIELRRRWRSVLVLGLLVAVVVATVLASLAGANRSASAFDRYLSTVDPPQALAFGDPAALAGLGDIGAVEAAVRFDVVAARPPVESEVFFPLVVAEDGVVPFERMRLPVVSGRLPDREAPREVALGERTATRLGLGVGGTIPLTTYTPRAAAALEEDEDAEVVPDGPALVLTVVGIVREPGDIGSRLSDITLTFLTPAFREEYGPDVLGSLDQGSFVFLREGRGIDEVTKAVDGQRIELDTAFLEASSTMGPTMDAIATALRVFALVVALAGLIAISQAVARMQQAAAIDDRTLSALGASQRARWTRLVAPAGLATLGGTVLGMLAAIPASVLFPVGVARKAEPDGGLDVDTWTLLLGGLGAALALTLTVAVFGGWRVRRSADPERPGPVSQWGRAGADLGLPASAVAGLSLAAGTRGRPGRIAVAGTLLSVLGVLAALVFSASVDRVQGDPGLYGWGWDAAIEGSGLQDFEGASGLAAAMDADDAVAAAGTLFTQVPLTIDGIPLFATAVDVVKGDIEPVVVRGEAPLRRHELALGRDSLDRLDAEIGDEVAVSSGGSTRTMRITAVVALPVPEDGGSSATGVYLSQASIEALDVAAQCDDSDSCTRTVAVDLHPGIDASVWAARYEDPETDTEVALPSPPGEIDRLTAVKDLPQYLAGFLALLAAAAVSFATATTVRQRRRDLAVLRVLGMTGRHVRIVVMFLVLALTATGAALGAALGLIVGREVWRAVATSVSLPFAPSVPLLAAVLIPLAAILLAQLVATISRRAAGHIPAAVVLRTE